MIESEPKDSWMWTGLLAMPAAQPVPLAPPAPAAPEPAQPTQPISAVKDATASLWTSGRVAFESGRYQEALENYQSILEQRPDHRASWFNSATCFDRLGINPEAESAYTRALGGEDAPAEANLCLGHTLLRVGKEKEATVAFGKSLDQKPDWTPALLGKAVALFRLGRVDETLLCYAGVPPPDDAYPGVLHNLISIAAARKDTDKLRESAGELLNLRRQSPVALSGLMQAEMASGDYKTAAQHGVRLIKHSPGSYEAWFNLGLCYQKTNHSEQAAQAYTEAIKIQPGSVPAHFNIGVILQEHGDVSGARREFERVLESQPDHVSALWNLAAIYEKDGQADRAEKIYLQLIREHNKVFESAFRLGLLRMDRENFRGSAEAFELCLLERAGDKAAAVNLSLARWRIGDRESAKQALHPVLRNDPDSVPALALSAALSIDEADWKTASQTETHLSELGEDTAILAYNIGVLQQAQGLHREAAVSFHRAIGKEPGFVAALVNAGHSLKAAGQADAAGIAWKAALEAKPELAGDYFRKGTALTAV